MRNPVGRQEVKNSHCRNKGKLLLRQLRHCYKRETETENHYMCWILTCRSPAYWPDVLELISVGVFRSSLNQAVIISSQCCCFNRPILPGLCNDLRLWLAHFSVINHSFTFVVTLLYVLRDFSASQHGFHGWINIYNINQNVLIRCMCSKKNLYRCTVIETQSVPKQRKKLTSVLQSKRMHLLLLTTNGTQRAHRALLE